MLVELGGVGPGFSLRFLSSSTSLSPAAPRADNHDSSLAREKEYKRQHHPDLNSNPIPPIPWSA